MGVRLTLHFHGTPITPGSVLETLAGRCFCVSFAAPEQVERVHKLAQSVMLDNGAFTFWRTGKATDWNAYYGWADRWLDYPTTWAVIPDVIDGDAEANDDLIRRWPLATQQSAPVWHMHEPIERLQRLVDEWPKVCIGSSAEYAVLNTPSWHRRMEQAMNAVCRDYTPWLHMLRGMAQSAGPYPFASVDSSDVAQNHHRPQNTAKGMVERWDAMQTPARWTPREQLELAA